MTYVVTENCIRCKYTDCVEVCPVDCFHEGPNFLVIDPEECIDCTLCEPECPIEAIFSEDDLPADQMSSTGMIIGALLEDDDTELTIGDVLEDREVSAGTREPADESASSDKDVEAAVAVSWLSRVPVAAWIGVVIFIIALVSLPFVLGGGVKGGRVIADWPGLKPQHLYQGRDLAPTTDLRAVLKGLLRDHLGLSERVLANDVFPETANVQALNGLTV